MDLLSLLPKCEACQGSWNIDKLYVEREEDAEEGHVALYLNLSCAQCGQEQIVYFTIEQLVIHAVGAHKDAQCDSAESDEAPLARAEATESVN